MVLNDSRKGLLSAKIVYTVRNNKLLLKSYCAPAIQTDVSIIMIMGFV